MGKRKIKQQLLHPTTDSAFLKKEYAIMNHLRDDFDVFDTNTKGLSNICDFERLYRKFSLKKAAPSELIHFLNNLKYIKTLNLEIHKDEILKNLYDSTKSLFTYKKNWEIY